MSLGAKDVRPLSLEDVERALLHAPGVEFFRTDGEGVAVHGHPFLEGTCGPFYDALRAAVVA